MTKRKSLAWLVMLVATLVVVATTSAASMAPRVPVYFVQGEQLVQVMRQGGTPEAAVRQLVAGPTAAEVKRGLRTYVPSGTKVLRVTVAKGLATVDLDARFVAGQDDYSLLARLSQLVRTVTGVQGARRVQLLIDGAKVSGVFRGIPTASPITFRYLQTPNIPVPKPPPRRLPAPDRHTKAVQQRLIELGYLVKGDADGRFGPDTQNAILSFQKWQRLDRTGSLDARTEARLATASRPTPVVRRGVGKRAEILLDRQVALLIRNDQLVRAIAVSTGKPSTPTPPGSYRVYAKIPRWWSTPFREWLPWALPFVGGIAFHEFAVVPAFAASHGCVRQAFAVARWTYAFAYVGMPVKVVAKS
jgi:hypothetical protein